MSRVHTATIGRYFEVQAVPARAASVAACWRWWRVGYASCRSPCVPHLATKPAGVSLGRSFSLPVPRGGAVGADVAAGRSRCRRGAAIGPYSGSFQPRKAAGISRKESAHHRSVVAGHDAKPVTKARATPLRLEKSRTCCRSEIGFRKEFSICFVSSESLLSSLLLFSSLRFFFASLLFFSFQAILPSHHHSIFPLPLVSHVNCR